MATASERLWRTGDGALVRDGDEAAQSLAYAPGDDIAPRDELLLPSAEKKPAAKAATKPPNKAAAKPDDK